MRDQVLALAILICFPVALLAVDKPTKATITVAATQQQKAAIKSIKARYKPKLDAARIELRKLIDQQNDEIAKIFQPAK